MSELRKFQTGPSNYREIRADFDRETIVVYQAFSDAIADAALKKKRFVSPFSLNRMTWIKPSFLWLMERSGWGTKSNQERILAVRITRNGWETALNAGVLTGFAPKVHGSPHAWREAFAQAKVHVQWDPERSNHGKKLDLRAIQVGLSRAVIRDYVSDWTVDITDMSPLVAKLRQLRKAGKFVAARSLLPHERRYLVPEAIAQQLAVTSEVRKEVHVKS